MPHPRPCGAQAAIPPSHHGHDLEHWPLHDTLILGSQPDAVPSARAHLRRLLWAWGQAAVGPDAGVVEFRIDGSEWRTQNLITSWSKTLHIPWAYVLDADLPPGKHELTMRVSSGAIRVVQMLVN